MRDFKRWSRCIDCCIFVWNLFLVLKCRSRGHPFNKMAALVTLSLTDRYCDRIETMD